MSFTIYTTCVRFAPLTPSITEYNPASHHHYTPDYRRNGLLTIIPKHQGRLIRRKLSINLPSLKKSDSNARTQFSFEDTVLKGLASDGGLFIPEAIPSLPADWQTTWSTQSFQELAFNIFSLYISPSEIPSEDLKQLIEKSYSTFRAPDITPLITLRKSENLHLLELFHGPTFAFKDVALQFVGNLFEYFLSRRNASKPAEEQESLTVIGATSGDTGSAAIYGLRGKQNISVFILHPKGKISPIQEAQMTSVLDKNVHNLAVVGTFDNCQVRTPSRNFLFLHLQIGTNHEVLLLIGYRQRTLRRHRLQRPPQTRRRKLHKLGPYSRPNSLLLPLLLRPPKGLPRPKPRPTVRRPHRKLRRRLGRLLRKANGSPHRKIGGCHKRK